MGQNDKKDLILNSTLVAPQIKLLGRYNGAVTVARTAWLEERGHTDKIQATILFDLLRLKLGTLNPSQYSVSDYLDCYRQKLEDWLEIFEIEYPTHLTWWIVPYSFDIQCETGKILIDDYSGDYTEWCLRHLQSRLA